MKIMTLSLVIPTLNEEKCLPRLLASLSRQTVLPEEIIFVDAMSRDCTRILIDKFKIQITNNKSITKFKIQIIDSLPTNSIAKARQLGSMAAVSDIIAGTDADCELPEGWMETVKNTFAKNPDVIAIFGPAGLYEAMPFLKKLFLKYADDLGILFNYYILRRPSMTGRNFAVKREAFLKIGGFNEKLFTHEDFDLGLRLSQIGKVLYVPELKVNTSARRAKENYSSILSRNFGNAIKLFLKKEAPENFPAIR